MKVSLKVSLKEARRIERRIESFISNGSYSLEQNISIYSEEDLLNSIVATKDKLEHDVLNAIALISARSNIRRSIQSANEASTINEVISLREEYIRILQVWKTIVDSLKYMKPNAILVKTIETKINQIESGKGDCYSTRTNEIGFIAVSENFHKHAVKMVRNTQTKIDDCDDNLASLNAITKIEIYDAIVMDLKSNNII